MGPVGIAPIGVQEAKSPEPPIFFYGGGAGFKTLL